MAPKRTSKINLLRPDQSFNQSGTFISGIFSVQQNEYDNQYVLGVFGFGTGIIRVSGQ